MTVLLHKTLIFKIQKGKVTLLLKSQNNPFLILICLLLLSTEVLSAFCICQTLTLSDNTYTEPPHCKLNLHNNHRSNVALENHFDNLQFDDIPNSTLLYQPIAIVTQHFSQSYSYTKIVRIDRPPQRQSSALSNIG